VQTSRGLFPHKRIIRRSEMTAKGLVVTEVQEDISGLPSTSGLEGRGNGSAGRSGASIASNGSDEPAKKSPISELLYMRWLEGLKLKWPLL
jgi:serine/threonine-protein kinase 24/25/MST4